MLSSRLYLLLHSILLARSVLFHLISCGLVFFSCSLWSRLFCMSSPQKWCGGCAGSVPSSAWGCWCAPAAGHAAQCQRQQGGSCQRLCCCRAHLTGQHLLFPAFTRRPQQQSLLQSCCTVFAWQGHYECYSILLHCCQLSSIQHCLKLLHSEV